MIREKKLFFAWQQAKEKEYLEQKALNGFLLTKVGFGYYEFEESEPKDMVYEFDFRVISKKELKEYLELFTDWELVMQYGGWLYFRKERTLNNEIYNDNSSKKEMFRRLIGFILLTGFPLYYQVLIMFPRLRESGGLSTFYLYFRPLVYFILLLHTYALVKLLLILRSYNRSFKE